VDFGKIVRIVVGLVAVAMLIGALGIVLPEFVGSGSDLSKRASTGYEMDSSVDYAHTDPGALLVDAMAVAGVDVRGIAGYLASGVLALVLAGFAVFVFKLVFGE